MSSPLLQRHARHLILCCNYSSRKYSTSLSTPANLSKFSSNFCPRDVVPRDVSFSIQVRGKQREGKTMHASRAAFNRGEDSKRRDAISERHCRHGFRILMGAHVKPDTAVLGPSPRQEATHSVASPGLCFVNLDRGP